MFQLKAFVFLLGNIFTSLLKSRLIPSHSFFVNRLLLPLFIKKLPTENNRRGALIKPVY